MSWNGTLRCSYCYTNGHSKRKCPTMKERHDEYVKLVSEGKTDDATWRQRSAHSEYKEMQETLKESNKVCSFCEQNGHRILTCPDRLGRVKDLEQINRYYKPLVRDALREIGFGKGCLVTRYEWSRNLKGEDEKKDVPYMVTSVTQGALDFCGLREGWGNITVTNMITMHSRQFNIPQDVRWAVTQAICHVDGHEWGENYWSDEAKAHPFQRTIRDVKKPHPTGVRIIAPSADPFSDSVLFHPTESKRDKNKMFREYKKRGDSERFTTEAETAHFITRMKNKFKEYKGWKL